MDLHTLLKQLNSLKAVFILLVALSFLVVMLILFPDIGTILGAYILLLWVLLGLSGVKLVIITFRKRLSGKVKFFLLSSGFSGVGFILGVVLHNLFYALSTLSANLAILKTVLNILEVGFFVIAVILCPIGLLVGVVGTILLWKNLDVGK